MKVCNKCNIEKKLSEFNKATHSKDGYFPSCKECIKYYYQINKEKILNHKKGYYEKNKNNILNYKKEYYEKNKELKKIYNKNYYQRNKEKVLKNIKNYTENNKYKISNKNKKYREKNKNKLTLYQKKYRKNNQSARQSLDAKRRAIKLQCTPPWIDSQKKEIEALYKKASELTKKTGIKHHIDHIYPLQPKKETDPVGLHVLANLQILTAEENTSKKNMQPEEWEKIKNKLLV